MPAEDGVIELARSELYARIWSTPTTQLAEELGISDVGLGKICRKHQIPKPPLGYWAKRQFGKSVPRPPLPPNDDPRLETIRIHRYLDPLDDTENLPPEFRRRIDLETDPANKIVVPDYLRQVHPLVAKTRESLSTYLKNKSGYMPHPRNGQEECLDLDVSVKGLGRGLRILNALLLAMEKRGYRVSVDKYSGSWRTRVTIDGVDVRIRLRETMHNAQFGRMALHILPPWGDTIEQAWWDRKDEPLEDRLNAFVCGILRVAGKRWIVRQEELRKERERQEVERRRQEEERKRKEEQERIDALLKEVDRWELCRRIRAYVQAVRDTATQQLGSISTDSPLAKWIEWVAQLADYNDPVLKKINTLSR